MNRNDFLGFALGYELADCYGRAIKTFEMLCSLYGYRKAQEIVFDFLDDVRNSVNSSVRDKILEALDEQSKK